MAVLFCACWSLPVGAEKDDELPEPPKVEQEAEQLPGLTRTSWWCRSAEATRTLMKTPAGLHWVIKLMEQMALGECANAEYPILYPFRIEEKTSAGGVSSEGREFVILRGLIFPDNPSMNGGIEAYIPRYTDELSPLVPAEPKPKPAPTAGQPI